MQSAMTPAMSMSRGYPEIAVQPPQESLDVLRAVGDRDPHAVRRADAAARLDHDAAPPQPGGEVGASVGAGGREPQHVGLRGRRLEAALAQRRGQLRAPGGDGLAAATHGSGHGPHRLQRAGLRQLVDAQLGRELLEQRLGAGAAQRVAAAQPRQAPRLGERAEHQQPREPLEQRERRVELLGVDEVAQRLVEQDHDALGQRREQRAQLVDARAARRSGRWGCTAPRAACGR